jgi:hypothetical protein
MVSGSRDPGCRRAEEGIWAILAILSVWIVVGRPGRSPTGDDGFSCSRVLLPSSGCWCGAAHRKTRPRSRPGRRRPQRRRASLSRLRPALRRRRYAQRLRHDRRLSHNGRLNHGKRLNHGTRLRRDKQEQSTRALEHIRLAAAARPATWSSPSLAASSPTSSRPSHGSRFMWSTRGHGHAPSMLVLDPSGW